MFTNDELRRIERHIFEYNNSITVTQQDAVLHTLMSILNDKLPHLTPNRLVHIMGEMHPELNLGFISTFTAHTTPIITRFPVRSPPPPALPRQSIADLIRNRTELANAERRSAERLAKIENIRQKATRNTSEERYTNDRFSIDRSIKLIRSRVDEIHKHSTDNQYSTNPPKKTQPRPTKPLHWMDTLEQECFRNITDEQQNEIILAYDKMQNSGSQATYPTRLKVLLSQMPETKKLEIFKKLENIIPGIGEGPKYTSWVDAIVRIPFGKFTELPCNHDNSPDITKFLTNARSKFDQEVYGHDNVKDEFISVLASWIRTGQSSEYGNVIGLTGPIGVGKCLSNDTKVPLWTGGFKFAKNILPGDLLIGDDSSPRTVQTICKGVDEMYTVHQNNGESYTVNQPHILSLKISGHRSCSWIQHKQVYRVTWFNRDTTAFTDKTFYLDKGNNLAEKKTQAHKAALYFRQSIDPNDILDIPVNEYLQLSKTTQSLLKGFKVRVDFPTSPVLVNPYSLGLWLGDTTSSSSNKFLSSHEATRGKNNLLTALITLNLLNNKHIPISYLHNDRETRLQLLAGLIDTHGSISPHDRAEITLQNQQLATDIAYLARSLGLYTYLKQGETKSGLYHKCIISGDLSVLLRRPPNRRTQLVGRSPIRRTRIVPLTDVLHTEITVQHIGKGAYSGFTLDGNRRFLLNDFTVTHNTTLVKEGLAKILNRPFYFISLGGSSNGSMLTGHGYTYEGACCGEISHGLMESECMDPVFYFDELDKVATGSRGEEIIHTLIHLTDPAQNTEFADRYFAGIPIDVSKALFVFSYNNKESINPILRDRIHEICLEDFKSEEKASIARTHIIPKINQSLGLTEDLYQFAPGALEHLAELCNQSTGLRLLKTILIRLLRFLNVAILTEGQLIINLDEKLFNQDDRSIVITKEILATLFKEHQKGQSPDKPPEMMYM
jgi:hypothetical protein